MSEKLTQKPITADPSKFSLREEALKLKRQGMETRFPIGYSKGSDTLVYVDKETGERFHKIYEAQFQKLLILILKGVVNVSDVVKVGDSYYSHEQNFDHIEPNKEDITAEIKADLFIIRIVFDDSDHKYYPSNHSDRIQTEREHPNSLLEHKNLLVDERNRKFTFFDFHKHSPTGATEKTVSIENPLRLEKMFEQDLEEQFKLDPNKNAILDILKKKVEVLISLHSDFERFKKILKRSGVELEEKGQRILFDNIILRLQTLNKVLSELAPSSLETKT